jgi:hypothetical protein
MFEIFISRVLVSIDLHIRHVLLFRRLHLMRIGQALIHFQETLSKIIILLTGTPLIRILIGTPLIRILIGTPLIRILIGTPLIKKTKTHMTTRMIKNPPFQQDHAHNKQQPHGRYANKSQDDKNWMVVMMIHFSSY